MSEIILFAPPYRHAYGYVKIRKMGYGVQPIGLSYIAGFLRERGHDVKLVDCIYMTKGWSDIRKLIEREDPDFIGISSTTSVVPEAKKLSEIAKEVNDKIKIVWGGIHASTLPEETAKFKNIDAVVCGEGELTMLEILEKNSFRGIRGVVYREGKRVKRNLPRPLIKNLDTLPFPAYDQLPLNKYGSPTLGNAVSVISGRGCPYNCIFCASKTIFNRTCRFRSPENFVSELEYLHEEYNINNFLFQDDLFTLSHKNIMEICRKIVKRGLEIKWRCNARVDTVSKKLLKIMKQAGCEVIHYGIESGDPAVLKMINKDVTISQIRRVVKTTKELGIRVYGYLILGFPFENEKTIQKTINFAKQLELDYAQFSLLTPFPGTVVWEMAKRGEGIKCIAKDWGDFNYYGDPIIELPEVSKEMLAYYHRKAYKDFYFRPAYIAKRILKSSPGQFLRDLKTANTILDFIKNKER